MLKFIKIKIKLFINLSSQIYVTLTFPLIHSYFISYSEIGSKQSYLMKRMSDEKSKITIVYNLITSPSIPSEDHQKTDQVLVLFYSNIFEILYSGKKADFLSDKIFTLHLTIHELRVLFSNK